MKWKIGKLGGFSAQNCFHLERPILWFFIASFGPAHKGSFTTWLYLHAGTPLDGAARMAHYQGNC